MRNISKKYMKYLRAGWSVNTCVGGTHPICSLGFWVYAGGGAAYHGPLGAVYGGGAFWP